nr:MAG TPA: hypothetical protein [Caudoviricetes sp.]
MLCVVKYLILLVFIVFHFIYFEYNNNKGRTQSFLVSRASQK